jgi:hypothetical protein
MLAIYVALIALLSIVLAGPMSPTGTVHILLAYLITHLNILVAVGDLSRLEKLIHMLMRFGSGGPPFILNYDTSE